MVHIWILENDTPTCIKCAPSHMEALELLSQGEIPLDRWRYVDIAPNGSVPFQNGFFTLDQHLEAYEVDEYADLEDEHDLVGEVSP